MTKIVKMRFQAFFARKFKGIPNCQIEERSHKQKCKQTFTNFLSFVILRYLNFCAKNEAKLQLYYNLLTYLLTYLQFFSNETFLSEF